MTPLNQRQFVGEQKQLLSHPHSTLTAAGGLISCGSKGYLCRAPECWLQDPELGAVSLESILSYKRKGKHSTYWLKQSTRLFSPCDAVWKIEKSLLREIQISSFLHAWMWTTNLKYSHVKVNAKPGNKCTNWPCFGNTIEKPSRSNTMFSLDFSNTPKTWLDDDGRTRKMSSQQKIKST